MLSGARQDVVKDGAVIISVPADGFSPKSVRKCAQAGATF